MAVVSFFPKMQLGEALLRHKMIEWHQYGEDTNITHKPLIITEDFKESEAIVGRSQSQPEVRKHSVQHNQLSPKMKLANRPSILLVMVVSFVDTNCVLPFSYTNCPCHLCQHANQRFPKNPLVALCAADDDNKIEWDPKSNPKIGQLPSYSDNWLLNFHNWDQSEKQLVTNSLAAWNEEIRNEQATIIEWQDSFQRNGLADFTPPMSNGLNCLMVGDDFGAVNNKEDNNPCVKLPWEEESEAQITSLRVLDESVTATMEDDVVTKTIEDYNKSAPTEAVINSSADNDIDMEFDSSLNSDVDENKGGELSTAGKTLVGTNGGGVRTELVPRDTTIPSMKSDRSSAIRAHNTRAATYDCIVDQGLMSRILVLENSQETVRELLEEAAIAIKDLGIYVLVTEELTQESRDMLEEYGLEAGLEWQFELDGISDGQVVSVARRFCTGEMPKVGRLSRYQPEQLW